MRIDELESITYRMKSLYQNGLDQCDIVLALCAENKRLISELDQLKKINSYKDELDTDE